MDILGHHSRSKALRNKLYQALATNIYRVKLTFFFSLSWDLLTIIKNTEYHQPYPLSTIFTTPDPCLAWMTLPCFVVTQQLSQAEGCKVSEIFNHIIIKHRFPFRLIFVPITADQLLMKSPPASSYNSLILLCPRNQLSMLIGWLSLALPKDAYSPWRWRRSPLVALVNNICMSFSSLLFSFFF